MWSQTSHNCFPQHCFSGTMFIPTFAMQKSWWSFLFQLPPLIKTAILRWENFLKFRPMVHCGVNFQRRQYRPRWPSLPLVFLSEVGLGYPGSEVPKSIRVQAKTAVRRTSERRGKNLWSPWTITSFWSLSDCMSNCFVRTSVAPQFDYKNVLCALRRKPGGKDKWSCGIILFRLS